MKRILLLFIAVLSFAVGSHAQTSTEGLMTTTPAGTLKTYDRSGYSYYNSNGYVRRGAQTGTMDVVYNGTTVYIKDPLSKAITGVWVKGQISADGTTITLPLGQAIAYDTNQKDSVVLGMMEYDEDYEEFSANDNVKQVTYTIKNDVLTLNGTSRNVILAAVWKKSRAWAEYGDYNSKYTLKSDDDKPVTVPSDLQSETYKLKGHTYVTDQDVSYNITLGEKDNNVYLKGLFTTTPDAWIVGTRNGNTITFKHGQYLAPTHTGTTNYYMIATNHTNTSNIEDLKLVYNETTGQYTTDQFVVLNTAKNTVYLVEALDKVVISKEANNGVYNVPYEETFSGTLSDYTIIDANNDGVTWVANSMSQTAEYNWSTKNDADDWLISPKILLKADTTYQFTVKARSMAGQLERMEVKMGSEATVDALTSVVIPATDVQTEDFKDFTATVRVKEDGAYVFGLHAITAANGNGLYIKDIRVDKNVATGIHSVNSRKSVIGNIYTIDGRRVKTNAKGVSGLPKGIYIVDGKKLVVK